MSGLNFEDENNLLTPIILYINYITFQQNDYFKINFKNTTPMDFIYLANIYLHQNISQKDLSELLYVSESNVAQIIKRLEKNGLVIRRIDENKKSRKNIDLTEKGRLLISHIIKVNYEWEDKFFNDYSSDEAELFKKMLYDLYSFFIILIGFAFFPFLCLFFVFLF